MRMGLAVTEAQEPQPADLAAVVAVAGIMVAVAVLEVLPSPQGALVVSVPLLAVLPAAVGPATLLQGQPA